MMPASNRGLGGELHFPDVCKAPAPPLPFIPLPLPNLSLNVLAAPFSPNVYLTFLPALNMMSMCPVTTGDEPGILGGIISQVIKGMQRVTLGNPVVFVNFMPGKNLLCPSSGNLMNAPLGATIIPSLTTVLFCYQSKDIADQAKKKAPTSQASVDSLRTLANNFEGTSSRPAVRSQLWTDGTGYLRIEGFGCGLSSRVYSQLKKLEAKGMRRLLIDLRGNPGGSVDAALDLADDFLAYGSLIAIASELDGETIQHRARKRSCYPWPTAIVIDAHCASAAELFAGSLKENARASLLGRPSAGKLAAQALGVGANGQAHYGTVRTYRFKEDTDNPGPLAVHVPYGDGDEPLQPGSHVLELAFATGTTRRHAKK